MDPRLNGGGAAAGAEAPGGDAQSPELSLMPPSALFSSPPGRQRWELNRQRKPSFAHMKQTKRGNGHNKHFNFQMETQTGQFIK
jgi:hypothetical protein